MVLKKSEINTLIAAIVIIGSVSFVKYVYIPYSKNVKSSQSSQGTYSVEKKILEIESAAKYKSMLKDMNSNKDVTQKRFYSGESETIKIEVLNTIEKESNKANIVIKDKNVWIDETKKEVGKVYCSINIAGPYSNVLRFLNGINKEDSKTIVEKLEIKRDNETKGNVIAGILIKGVIIKDEKN